MMILHQFYHDEGITETNDMIDWKHTKYQKLNIFSALLNSHSHCILDVPISLIELKCYTRFTHLAQGQADFSSKCPLSPNL